MKRVALITGINGQDGSYLAEFLLENDYTVFGLIRRSSERSLERLTHLLDRITLLQGDMTDQNSLNRAVASANPNEVYHLAAQSQVATSFHEAVHTADVTGLGTLRMLDAVRLMTPISQHTRFYQASSSEMFGNTEFSQQSETTPFSPTSPYGCAKVFAHHVCHTYRASYQMFVACGIAYNHESPRRSPEFVTRKITKAIGQIKAGRQDILRLGNLSTQRDWSHARDIVRGMWLALQHPIPEDFIFASGVSHTVHEFMELAFNYAGLNYHPYIKVDPNLFRPSDISQLVGNTEKAVRLLGWKHEIPFHDLVEEMVVHDCSSVTDHSLRAS